MNAQIIAIGIFTKDIIPYLEYPEEFYSDTHEGIKIAQIIFFIETGSTDSRELAECFGISPWDFNKHFLNPHDADLLRLHEMFDDDMVDSFIGLREAGFDFYFFPNG